MKKLAIIAILAATTIAATAADFGLRVGRNAGAGTNNTGLTIGQNFGAFGAEAAFDRSTVGDNNVNRYSLVATREVTKVSNVSVLAKAGVAFVDPTYGDSGAAGLVGVGLSYPVTSNVSLVADYAYQFGQTRVRQFNGNQVSAGVKYSF